MGNTGKSRRRLAIALGIIGVLAVAAALWLRRGVEGGSGEAAGAGGGGATAAGTAGANGARGGASANDAAVRSPDELGGPLRLDGQLIDEAGAPVGDALVAISTEPPRTTRSQADGSFAFDKLIPRHFTLHAQGGDLVGAMRYRLTSTSDPAIVRMRRGTRVLVRVLDEAGAPIAGAEVRAPLMYLEEVAEEVRTGADGKATLRGLGNLPWGAIRASAAGYAPSSTNAFPDVSERGETSVQITLRRGVAVSGAVRDEKGSPVAGAKIYCSSMNPSRQGVSLDATSDAEGAFRFPAIAAGEYTLSARHPAYSSGDQFKSLELGGEAVTGLELTLTTGATLAGTVVHADGSPAPYAIVKAAALEEQNGTPRWVASDDQGRFELVGLPRKRVQVIANHERAASALAEVMLDEAPRKDELRLVLDVTGALSGVVVDERGEPVPEVQVKAQNKNWMSSFAENYLKGSPVTMTDGSGAFAFQGLADEDYLLTLNDERPDMRGQPDTYRPGTPGIKLVMPRQGTIVGRIVDERGEPLTALTYVTLDKRGPSVTSTGSFRLEELRPDTYQLQLHANDRGQKTLDGLKVVAGETLDLGDLKLEAGRRIRGRVVDGEGAPVAGAKVRSSRFPSLPLGPGALEEEDVFDIQMGIQVATSDARGDFELASIPSGEEQFLSAHIAGGSSPHASVAAGAGDPPPLTLVINRYGSVEGVVTKNGKPVKDAVILITPRKRDGTISVSGDLKTGADGRFLAPRVASGEMEVQALRGSMLGIQKPTPITVEAGKRARVALELTGGDATLTVEVKAQKGQRVDSADVALFDGAAQVANGEDMLERANRDGSGRQSFWSRFVPTAFPDLQPGAYTLCGVPFTGDMMDRELMQRAFHHRAKRPAICKPVTVTASPAEQRVTLELPSMPALPPVPADKLPPIPPPKP